MGTETPGHRRRVLVTGSRTWTDSATIRAALSRAWGDGTHTLVVGACPRGADALAERCWRAWGGHVERHPARWREHGRGAGFRRNADMVARGADLCLAFIRDHSRGATHTADLADGAGITTHRYQHPTEHRGTFMTGTQQGALFGDPVAVEDNPIKSGRPVTQDVELVASVVRLAVDPGYRVVERSGRVFRVDSGRKGAVEDVPRYEGETVMQLVDAGLLELGGNHTITYRGNTGPSRSVLVPKDTRHRVSRWANLRPLPASSVPTPRAPSSAPVNGTTTRTGQRTQRPTSGTVHVDVVERGKALVSIEGANAGGTIVRDRHREYGSGYYVENDNGHVLGGVSSFRAGAEKLARHHGYRPGPVEIEHEHRDNPPF